MLIPALVCGLFFGLARGSKDDLDLRIDLGYATYQGANAANGVSQWFGIRYAAPPVGDLRFRAPRDPLVENKIYTADTHGPVCHSSPSTSFNNGHSEDCLFLDVYAPSDNEALHPVFVFFQGGGFNTNSAPNMNPNSLINAGDRDMVVITFNYRVGPYGFLASKEVRANGDLNAGLLDQRKVLQWIQKYIHLFGGDPTHVTIGGASAGGASVDLHLSAYGGRDDGLFHAAAAESQSFGPQFTVAEAQYQYDALVKRVGCNTTADTLKCLRGVDIRKLAESNPDIPTPGGAGGNPVYMWSNVIDGNFTTDYTYNLFAQGKFVKVPSIFGDTTNEGTIFTPNNINNFDGMNSFLKNNYVKLNAAQLAQIDMYYPQAEQFSGKGTYWRSAANAYGEMRYICPGIFISSAINRQGAQSWNYHWDVLSTNNVKSGLGVTHSAETDSIWGTSGSPDKALTPAIQSYWASFIRTKDPNTFKINSAPTWETFDSVGMKRVHFPNDPKSVAMETVPAAQKDRCQYLSGIGPKIAQ